MRTTSSRAEIPEDIGDYLELRDGGKIFWKVSISKAKKGEEASAKHRAGYLCVGFRGKVYLSHRVVFFLSHGWCPRVIDHIDGNRQNNDPVNLRPASMSLNGLNRPSKSNNSSGRNGVFWSKAASKWRAEITIGRKNRHLGYFPCLIDAVAARMRAERSAISAETGGQ